LITVTPIVVLNAVLSGKIWAVDANELLLDRQLLFPLERVEGELWMQDSLDVYNLTMTKENVM
jgi:hypothetical protein